MSKDGLRYENSGIWDGGKQLTTFRAKILKETAIYDRDNCVGRMLTIEARLGETQQTFEIDAAELNRIDWVSKHVGIPDEVCFVSAKEMAKAIISLSKTSKRLVRRFISMGFQAIDGQPVYVHGGGVLGAPSLVLESVEARLNDAFSGYGFPNPSMDTGDRANYLAAPLELLTISKKNPAIGVIALGSAVRAVLCRFHSAAVTSILVGDSGAGKSALMALAMSLFWPDTDVNKLPFNLISTSKGLRHRAAESAHTLFPVDDYFPTPGKRSDDEAFIEMLVWGASTTAGRQTAKSATEAEWAAGIETVVMLTAEVALVTDKESRHVRALYCELDRDDVDPTRRIACLNHARNGDLARGMREFIIACLSRHDRLQTSVREQFERYQRQAEEAQGDFHRRHWANVADIMVGVHYYLRFCRDEGVINQKRYEYLRGRSWEALLNLAKTQSTLIDRYASENVVARAFEQLLRQGKYHLRQHGKEGRPQGVQEKRVGWVDGQPQGEPLGYLDTAAQTVYVPTSINTGALHAALPANARRMLPCGSKAFWKRLVDQGIVQSEEQDHNSVKKQRFGNGRFYRLHLSGLFR